MADIPARYPGRSSGPGGGRAGLAAAALPGAAPSVEPPGRDGLGQDVRVRRVPVASRPRPDPRTRGDIRLGAIVIEVVKGSG